MADPNDVYATKLLRREFNRHHINTTHADLRVTHGVAYIRGTVAADRGSGIADIRIEIERIARNLKVKAEFKDVIIDCRYRE